MDKSVQCNAGITDEMYYMAGLRKYMSEIRRGLIPVLLVSILLSCCDTNTVQAAAAARKYTITASAGPGGSISPSGQIRVDAYKDQTFTITPDPNYKILDVVVDGKSLGALSTYTFERVRSNHTITATFASNQYTITASAGSGGTISPSGEQKVNPGSSLTFTISADADHAVWDVMVDGISAGPVDTYTFDNVSSDHTIHATFVKKVIEVLNVTIPDQPMKIGSVVTATITVEDDMGISYTLVSGSVGGYPLEDFQRLSATTYQAYFTIYQGGNSYHASQDIPVSNVVISNGRFQSAPYNLPIVQSGDPIDAEAPRVLKMEVPSIEVGVGGTVKVTITADGTGYSAGTATMVNGVSLGLSLIHI